MTLDLDRLLTWCQAELAWQLATIESLARIESPSHDKAAIDRCGVELARRLREIGGEVTIFPSEAGDHVRAEFGGAGAGAPDDQVLLLGHFDTVWDVGQLDRMPLREADGRLYGPGVFDMKSGIAVAMLAVRALHRRAVYGAVGAGLFVLGARVLVARLALALDSGALVTASAFTLLAIAALVRAKLLIHYAAETQRFR